MTTSEPRPVFVWIWLPGAHDPVVARRLDRQGQIVVGTPTDRPALIGRRRGGDTQPRSREDKREHR